MHDEFEAANYIPNWRLVVSEPDAKPVGGLVMAALVRPVWLHVSSGADFPSIEVDGGHHLDVVGDALPLLASLSDTLGDGFVVALGER